jgi:isopentenyl diphosphate isomerase/L-lactate dehydrogenase-like FMN-dependent dehydrogenase
VESLGRAVQGEIYRAGAFGRRPRVPVHPEALEAAARARMSRRAWSYVAGAAGAQHTVHANRAAFDRWGIVPRHLRDISRRDMSVELFGRHLPAPVLLAPIGACDIVRRHADLAVAQAATDIGLPMIVSSQGSDPMEETARALGAAGAWFQLYWSSSEELTASFVRRAEAIGSQAIVVTLDTQMLGWRPMDLDLGSLPFVRGLGLAQYTSDPVFMELVRERLDGTSRASGPSAAPAASSTPRPTLAAIRTLFSVARAHPGGLLANLRSPLPRAAVETFLDVFANPTLTWDDLAWLRERTSLPIVLKGILSPADAVLAVDHGMDGVIVSNHGGRQVDGAIAALDALPGVVEAVAGRLPVVFDSGIRSGADVYKALALGARAVLLGRPWVYGLALDGAAGVRAVLRHVLAELDLTMALTGARTVAEIGEISPLVRAA